MGVAGAFALAGCTSSRPTVVAPTVAEAPVKAKGTYKVGSPYQVNGVWYYPSEDWSYDETGIASWYGPDFHGKSTANGESFDQNAVTAAHRTLPMPSFVRVTNLENGRSLEVRINDRGPYAAGRILDLSRRSAQLLGIEERGTARVRVQIMAEESRFAATALRNPDAEAPPIAAAPVAAIATETLAPPPGAKAAPARPAPVRVAAAAPRPPLEFKEPDLVNQQVVVVPVKATRVYIQAGAFQRFEYANRLQAQLSALGKAAIMPAHLNGGDIFRVRMGPFDAVEDADRQLDRVIKAGYTDARIVVD